MLKHGREVDSCFGNTDRGAFHPTHIRDAAPRKCPHHTARPSEHLYHIRGVQQAPAPPSATCILSSPPRSARRLSLSPSCLLTIPAGSRPLPIYPLFPCSTLGLVNAPSFSLRSPSALVLASTPRVAPPLALRPALFQPGSARECLHSDRMDTTHPCPLAVAASFPSAMPCPIDRLLLITSTPCFLHSADTAQSYLWVLPLCPRAFSLPTPPCSSLRSFLPARPHRFPSSFRTLSLLPHIPLLHVCTFPALKSRIV